MPNDKTLRLLRARLHRISGDGASAEREYREVLASDPTDQAALESLVSLLGESGRAGAADEASLSALDRQPTNLANNLRMAIVYDTHHDDARSAACLLAAERSGPVTSAVEFHLAQQLFRLQRIDETLSHLAEARRISLYEGDLSATASITHSIDSLWSQLH
jgi:predicted Zn-dependent protease